MLWSSSFSSFINIWSSEKNTEITEESDYSDKNTSDKEDIRSTTLQPFQFEPEQKKTCGNESHEKETKHMHVSAADLLHGIGNLDWYKCGRCKTKRKK